jgi:cell division protein FtsB
MKRKHLLFLILISLLILGTLTFFGENGILHLFRLQKELARIKEMNFKLEEENQKLKEEVKRLQTDKRYIEEIARKELGMVKAGEIIYQFDTPSKGKEHSK